VNKCPTGFPRINFCNPRVHYERPCIMCGSGSSVGIATDCGMDGPGSNPRGDEIFRTSGPALGLTQPPPSSAAVTEE